MAKHVVCRVALPACVSVAFLITGCRKDSHPIDAGPQLKAYPSDYDITGGYRFVDFAGKPQRVVSGGSTIRIFDLQSGKELCPPMKHGGVVVNHAAFSSDAKRVITACNDHHVRIWSSEGKLLFPPMKHGERGLSFATFSPSGEFAVSLSWDHTVVVWNARTGKKQAGPISVPEDLQHAAFSPDGRWFVAVGAEAHVRETATGKLVFKPIKHDWVDESGVGFGSLVHVAVSPNGRVIATGAADGLTFLWNAKTGKRLSVLRKHHTTVRHIAFSFDSRRIATASFDGTARVWRSRTGAALTPPLTHKKNVNHICFSPDCTRVATSSDDGTAKIWDASKGTLQLTLSHDDLQVFRAEFSPDGKTLVTYSALGIRSWNSETGALISVVAN